MVTMEIRSNKLPGLANAIHRKLVQVVTKTAFDIERDAKGRAPVDTGALRASIYTVTATSSGYGAAIGQAKAAANRRTKKRKRKGLSAGTVPLFFPEVNVSRDTEAIVAVAACYGLFIEFGTIRMAAQPFFTPAIEAHRQEFLDAVGEAVRGAI